MTLDGKIAPPPGAPPDPTAQPEGYRGTWISGEAARAHAHQLRHQHDAIMVGVGTILADDPLLTDRSGLPRRRPLLRVVLDSQLRIPVESRIAKSSQNDVLVFCCEAEEGRKPALEALGMKIEEVPAAADGRPDLRAVMKRLGQLEITSVLVEGGSAVNAAVLVSGVADKIFLYYAPTIFANNKAVSFAAGHEFNGLSPVPRAHSLRIHHLGDYFDDDFAVEGYFRDLYSEY